jgi:hypothetical protein
MQAQMLGQLFGVRRPSQLAEQREQPRPGCLRKNIPWSGRYIHALQFCKARLGKPGLNVFCGGRAELMGFRTSILPFAVGAILRVARIGDNAAFNVHTIGLMLMIVGASVLSCPSCSGIRGAESVVVAAIGGSDASRGTAQVDASKRVQRHVELAVARAGEYPLLVNLGV